MSSESGERRPARMAGTAPQKSTEPENLPCPRCDSTNTKFCYYNNYNLSQPRHFCKSCRRYWTRGGTLRNVPVGGGTRKAASSNKRPRTAASPPEIPREQPFQTPGSGCDVNLNEAVPDPGPASFTSLLGSPVGGDGGGGFMSLGGFGLGLGDSGMHGFGFGLGMVDWPAEPVGGVSASGNVNGGGTGGPVGSSSCNTWQMGGVDGGLADGGDYFGWPDLAISAPGRRS